MTDASGAASVRSRIERVERTRVSDSVVSQLTQLIKQEVYKVGEKLPPERVLSEQFGVSRSSMREAIRSIEANGLVSSNHGVGVFVIRNSLDNPTVRDLLVFDDFTMPELFEVRRTLEGDAAALAAQRRTAADTEELLEILRECDNPDLPDEEFVQLDIRLHQTVARAARNGLLVRLYRTIEPLMLEYSRRVIELPGRREHAHQGHRRIVEAIASGRSRDARSAAIAHIRDVEADITQYLADGAR